MAAQGSIGLKDAIAQFHAEQGGLPALASPAIRRLIGQVSQVTEEVRKTEKKIAAWCRADAASRRLITIPGIGPISASAISPSVPDPKLFRSGRQFAA